MTYSITNKTRLQARIDSIGTLQAYTEDGWCPTVAQLMKGYAWAEKCAKGWQNAPQDDLNEHIEWLFELLDNAIEKEKVQNIIKLVHLLKLLID